VGLPVTSALDRRDRLWPAVVVSLLAHGVLVAWGLARRPPAPLDLDQKPIVAKLVRLGEKRPEEWLPRKEEAPPPPAPAAAPAAPAAPTPAKPAAPSLEAKAPPKPAAPSPAAARGAGNALASVLSRVQKQVEEQRWGSPDGDPAGDSETGAEGERYLALVHRELEANYNVPSTISRAEATQLSAVVVLIVDTNGRIVGHDFERRSGNAAYDAALERAIRSSHLPPPPPELAQRIARSRLVVSFHL
jgi:colicin import membrane protein